MTKHCRAGLAHAPRHRFQSFAPAFVACLLATAPAWAADNGCDIADPLHARVTRLLNEDDAKLHAAAIELDDTLDKLGKGDGSADANACRYALLADKAKLLARLNDRSAALVALSDVLRTNWLDARETVLEDPYVRALSGDPRLIMAVSHVTEPWHASDEQALASPFRKTLPVEERLAGLSLIWSVARDNFVWFDHVPDLNWTQAYLDAIPRVMAAKDTESYYRELMRFVALLHDGHSNVYPPTQLETRFYSRPGLRTALVEDQIVVTEIADSGLEKQGMRVGDLLDSVDGVPVRRYAADNVAPYQSSSTAQGLDVRRYNYALLAGPGDHPVKLGLRHADGSAYTLAAPRTGYSHGVPKPTEHFELRADGVAVLRVRHLSTGAAVKLLERHSAELLHAKGFVLDLRGNEGGNSSFGLELLSWLSDKPIPVWMSHVRGNSAYLQTQLNNLGTLGWRRLDNTPYEQSHDKVYSGPVVMLIDARTFSAGEDTAAAFRLMKRGLIIGAPSGGSTGQPAILDLPGGGRVRLCVKRDSYPDGSDFVGSGVLPDIQVAQTLASVRAGTDPVMERALQALRTGQ